VVSSILTGNEPGFELDEETHPNAIERFVVLSVRGSPRLLLPPEGPIMHAAIMNFLGNRRGASLVPKFVHTASRIKGPFSSLCSDLALTSQNDGACSLRSLISDVLGRDDYKFAMRLSLNRPNPKIVVMAISNAGEVLCFAKFGTEELTNELVAHESAVLEQFAGTDMPFIVPKSLYSGTWADTHNVLITAPLQLESLNGDASIVHQAADAFACQNLVTNSALSKSDYWRQVDERIRALDPEGNSNEPLLASASKIEQLWGDRQLDFGASHGDWTRANLGMVEGHLAAFDWERCTKLAPRGIDIAHFAVSENLFRPFSKTLDVDHANQTIRQYFKSAGMLPDNAESLITLALLEMVIRFKSAQKIGLRSKDSKFESALNTCLEKWSA